MLSSTQGVSSRGAEKKNYRNQCREELETALGVMIMGRDGCSEVKLGNSYEEL